MRLKKSNSYVQTDLFRTLLQCSFPSPGGGGVGMLRDDTKLVNGFACLGGYIGDYVFILDLLFVQTICPSSSVETANIKKKNCSSDGHPNTFIVLSLRNVAERYFGFLLRSLNALLIQNRHSLVGWEASFLKLPTPESWKKVNFMPCYLIRTSTGKNFHMVIRYTVHSHFSQDRQEPWAPTGSGGHLGFICKKMYWGGKRRDL